MAPHSSTLAWKIPWAEEPGRLQSMGSRRVRHDWATSLSLFTFMHWKRKRQLTPVFLPGESQGRGAWWAAVHGVAQSRTRLKRLSSSRYSLLLGLFSSYSDGGLLSSCGAWTSHCYGFSCCGTWVVGLTGFSSCSSWAQYCCCKVLEHRLNSCDTHA